jgi:hypothetical protein
MEGMETGKDVKWGRGVRLLEPPIDLSEVFF